MVLTVLSRETADSRSGFSMNEMRYDWLSDRWVIFAPNRLARPDDFSASPAVPPNTIATSCPFCKGSETQTPEPTLVINKPGSNPNQNEWLVRVVPNKFPAVSHSHPSVSLLYASCLVDPAPINHSPSGHSPENLFLKRFTSGAHEVFIESPNHVSSITSLPIDHLAVVFQAYRERLLAWRKLGTMRYGVVFKNYGLDAGASLIHSHSQLICTDFLPSDVFKVQKRMQQYMDEHRRCYVCDVLEQELQSTERIVAQNDHYVALCPFASRLPYSVSIVPKRHQSQFETSTNENLEDLARIAMRVLKAFETEHPQASYNTILQTSPFDLSSNSIFHWRLKIIPRLCKVAGFEWSSDCFINTVTPEDAARNLRQRCELMPGHFSETSDDRYQVAIVPSRTASRSNA